MQLCVIVVTQRYTEKIYEKKTIQIYFKTFPVVHRDNGALGTSLQVRARTIYFLDGDSFY